MPEWEKQFQNCMVAQERLEFEAWDVILFEPLKDLAEWWLHAENAIKAFLATLFLRSRAAKWAFDALVKFLEKILKKAAGAGLVGPLVEALGAAVVGMAFVYFMDILVRCLVQSGAILLS